MKIEIVIDGPDAALAEELDRIRTAGPRTLAEGITLEVRLRSHTQDAGDFRRKMIITGARLVVTFGGQVGGQILAAEIERLLHPVTAHNVQSVTIESHTVDFDSRGHIKSVRDILTKITQ